MERLHATQTLARFVRMLADAYGDRPAVDDEDVVLTYRQLVDRSSELAQGLLYRGIGKGSRVALIFANGADFAVAIAAVTRIGAIAVPLSTLLKPPELARVLRHGDIQAVLAQQEYAGQDFAANLACALPLIEASRGFPLCLPGAPFLRWVTFLDRSPAPAWAHDLSWLQSAGAEGFSDELLAAAESEVHPEDPALMVYTSGQSAEPKGVVHGHRGILQKTHYLRAIFGFEPGDRVPGELPFFWVGGMVMSLFPVFDAGGTVTCQRAPATDAPILGAMGAKRPNFRARGARGAHMKMLVGLGMTETFGPYSWGEIMPVPEHPLCPPLVSFEPGYDIKVVGADGDPVPEGGIGEILLRGPTMMLGLHKVDTASTFDADGFYRTGDRVVVGAGPLYFVGRLGDMIKVSGANVAPAEVERELLAIEGIIAAHVVGVDDADRGQIVGAAVVVQAGVLLEPVAIRQALKDRLSSYKVPKVLAILSAAEIPTLPAGKIAKRELAAMLRRRAGTDLRGRTAIDR
ncbi:class I adenylate-forming enzyme family protein [Mycobacterium sp. DL440]|uniref:class I adenylate-forming enzyme family protein n=1 Tax=Mycobacterium sp. DL440 TaxID=2675523 RepID=UPI001AAFF705|nr:class I adenylate-forming enzyme family protein [Mycobacterium sp. DL440]